MVSWFGGRNASSIRCVCGILVKKVISKSIFLSYVWGEETESTRVTAKVLS